MQPRTHSNTLEGSGMDMTSLQIVRSTGNGNKAASRQSL
jgi:hypothetical protein